MKIIGHIHNDFPTKFGIPHQSGRLSCLKATVVFEPEYRNPDAFRGLEEFSYIWLIWQFSQAVAGLVAYCETAKAWWKYQNGCVCHPFPVSP